MQSGQQTGAPESCLGGVRGRWEREGTRKGYEAGRGLVTARSSSTNQEIPDRLVSGSSLGRAETVVKLSLSLVTWGLAAVTPFGACCLVFNSRDDSFGRRQGENPFPCLS